MKEIIPAEYADMPKKMLRHRSCHRSSSSEERPAVLSFSDAHLTCVARQLAFNHNLSCRRKNQFDLSRLTFFFLYTQRDLAQARLALANMEAEKDDLEVQVLNMRQTSK